MGFQLALTGAGTHVSRSTLMTDRLGAGHADAPTDLLSLARASLNQRPSARLHTNGFLKVRLATYADGSRLRAHFWDEESAENLHSHRWTYDGLVLHGELEELLYEEGVGHTHTRWTYQTPAAGEMESLRDPRPVRVIVERRDVLGATCHYRRETTGAIHQVRRLTPECVSLVLTQPPVQAHSYVYAQRGAMPALRRSTLATPATVDAAVRRLEQLL